MLPAALLSLALAVSPAETPDLPAALAWLEDRDDHPLVSRRLVLAEPRFGQRDLEPRVLLEPLLYSFDAADHQRVGWLGRDVVVNGPVSTARAAPNVRLPIHVVPTDGGPRTTVPELHPTSFHPAPDGDVIVTLSLTRLGFVELADGEPVYRALLEEERGRSQLRGALWSRDGRSLLLTVTVGRGALESGLWRLPYRPRTGSQPPRFGAPEKVANGPAHPTEDLGDGTLLVTSNAGRERYSPHRLERHRLERDPLDGSEPRERLADDVAWTRAAAARPGPRGEWSGEVAYVRHGSGDLVLRRCGEVDADRVLLPGPLGVRDLAWSPDGEWLAFTRADAERGAWIHVLEVDTCELHRLGRGLRPAWGPAYRPLLPVRLQDLGTVALVSARVDADGGPAPGSTAEDVVWTRLPAGARATATSLVAHRKDGARAIPILTFERAGERRAYGVYGLWKVKNHMPVDLPLGGDPIAWDERDHAQAFAHQLERHGVAPGEARALVEAHAEAWFGDGLRVFFFVSLPQEEELPGLALPESARVLVVRMELER